MIKPARIALCAALLPLGATGCATLGNLHGSTAKTEDITVRNKAVVELVTGLSPCAPKGKPEDNGVMAVSAASDGTISIDAWQWNGSAEMKACIVETASKMKLPPWGGATTAGMWSIGTKDHPAPPPLAEEPKGFRTRFMNQFSEMTGAGLGDMGPLNICVQQNLSNDAYAKITYQMTVFPDGKVAAVTPIEVDGEGRDAGFQECVRKLLMQFTFDPFPGPGYYTLPVPPVQKGMDNQFK